MRALGPEKWNYEEKPLTMPTEMQITQLGPIKVFLSHFLILKCSIKDICQLLSPIFLSFQVKKRHFRGLSARLLTVKTLELIDIGTLSILLS